MILPGIILMVLPGGSRAASGAVRAGARQFLSGQPQTPADRIGGNGFFVQYYGLNMLAQAGFGSVALPITGASCLIFFTLYSLFRLRERFTLPGALALAFCIIGVILMSLKNL